jgi:subtilase family serine protease
MSDFQQSGKLYPMFLPILLFLVLAGLVPPLAAQSAPPDGRITDAVDERQLIELKGQVNPRVGSTPAAGVASGELAMERMMLLLGGSPAQQASFEELLAEQQDPASSNYRHWLTPREFGEQFGPAPRDVETISAWLRGHGFSVNAVAQGRRFIEFSGTAAQVAEAFHTQINRYVVDGKPYWANATDPYIPAALAPLVKGIASLHNFPRRAMHGTVTQTSFARTNAKAAPQFNLSNGTYALGPYDFATIYNVLPLWSAGTIGSGQTIAIAARSEIDLGDVSDFQNLFGLPLKPPQIILNGPDPGIVSDDEDESELDVQWSGAVAQGAAIQLVVSASTNSADGIDLSSAYIVDNNLAPVVSLSYGSCEQDLQGSQLYNLLWQQAAAQGMSVFVSAGDAGSAGCDDPSSTNATQGFAVNGLASTPYNVAVGGTEFNENESDSTYWSSTPGAHLASALSYIPEVVWNETTVAESGAQPGLWAGGGGVSIVYGRPAWQTGNGVPATDPNSSGHHRLLPDVSLSAAEHDGYIVCLNRACRGGSVYLIYGTSASVQAFAGLMALVDQSQGSIQGNPNFHLYPLSNTSGVYHDITSGTNEVPCAGGSPNCSSHTNGVSGAMNGYPAGPGYDLATGWGSVDANQLVTNWSYINFAATTTTASITPHLFTHGSSVSYSFTVASTSGNGMPSGAVGILIAGNSVTGLPDFPLTNGTAAGTSRLDIPGGNSVLTVRYGGNGSYGASTSAGIPLTVAPESSVVTLAAPGTVAAFSTFSLTATVTGHSGVGTPTGQVTFLQGVNSVGSASLNSSGIATVAIAGPAIGQYNYSASYPGDSSFNAGNSANQLVTIGKATVALTVTASTNQAIPGSSVTVIATLASLSATGTLQFYDNGTLLGGAVSVSNGAAQLTTSSLALGVHSITASYSGDANFNSINANSSIPFTVTIAYPGSSIATPDFALTATPSVSVVPGGAVSVFISTSGIAGFSGILGLSCSGLPAETSCSFSPTSPTAGSGTYLTITTTAPRTASLHQGQPPLPGWWRTSTALLLGGVLLFTGARRKQRYWYVALSLLLASLLIAGVGCGGGGSSAGSGGATQASTADPGTPTGTYTVTVTATSRALTHSTTFTLTVN